jgi:hypothetical protein
VGSLADDLAARTIAISVDGLLAELDGKDRAEFERALAEPDRWPHTALARYLCGQGYEITARQIQTWRNRALR